MRKTVEKELWKEQAARPWAARQSGLGCATFCRDETCDAVVVGGIHRNGVLETVQDFIGGVLEAGIGFMQFARCFGCKLTELITIVYVRKGTKDQIRAHIDVSPKGGRSSGRHEKSAL
jgi:hypothetical protein